MDGTVSCCFFLFLLEEVRHDRAAAFPNLICVKFLLYGVTNGSILEDTIPDEVLKNGTLALP